VKLLMVNVPSTAGGRVLVMVWASFFERLPPRVDAFGENGEFHIFVYDGPNFAAPVWWTSLGKETYVSPPEYGSQTYYFDLLGV
jgi:diphthamide synthase (EF-2-diphthine--ammonia ligase)